MAAHHTKATADNQEYEHDHVQTLPDPEDMVLLREKLTQIAVGDNQLDHMGDDDDDDDVAGGPLRRRHAPSGHFRLFLSNGDRPSTPPSSPQPRDVLRKQLRMKNHVTLAATGSSYPRPLCHEDSSSDTASDELLDGMCVDGVEISPLPYDDARPTTRRPSVRLSVPEHLQTRPSSYSTMSKCPEGFRKRKSVHIDDKELDVDGHLGMLPLKRVSSQANVQSAYAASWEHDQNQDQDHDQEMEEEDPSGSPPSDAS